MIQPVVYIAKQEGHSKFEVNTHIEEFLNGLTHLPLRKYAKNDSTQ